MYHKDLLKESVRLLGEVLCKIFYFKNEEIEAQILSNLFMATELERRTRNPTQSSYPVPHPRVLSLPVGRVEWEKKSSVEKSGSFK